MIDGVSINLSKTFKTHTLMTIMTFGGNQFNTASLYLSWNYSSLFHMSLIWYLKYLFPTIFSEYSTLLSHLCFQTKKVQFLIFGISRSAVLHLTLINMSAAFFDLWHILESWYRHTVIWGIFDEEIHVSTLRRATSWVHVYWCHVLFMPVTLKNEN